MPLIQTQPPSIEPVRLDEARNHLRLDADQTGDDDLVTMLLGAARRYAESYCGRSFITQQWQLVLDSFPGPSLMGVPYGRPYSIPGHAILLEKGTVQRVDSIQYTAMDGSTQTMPAADYAVELSSQPGRITPVFGKIWPITLPQIGAVRVNYTAGYGDTAESVPEGIRQWILMRVNSLYGPARDGVIIEPRVTVQSVPFIDGLLDPYRVIWQ